MAETPANETQREPPIQETWGSREFIQNWISKDEWRGPIREMQTATVVTMVPHPLDQPIRVLDLAAGFGSLAIALLKDRPNATALCLDASEEMLKMGREKTAGFGNRFEFVRASLEGPVWLQSINGTYDVVVSARALHHFTANQRRRYLYREIYDVLRPGGCFINADNVRAQTKSLRDRYRKARELLLEQYIRERSGGKQTLAEVKAATPSSSHGPHNNGLLEEELSWLREAGFEDVDCFWKFSTTTVYGGFRSNSER